MPYSLTETPKVGIFPCPNCGQTINTSMKRCPYCNAFIDPIAAETAAEAFTRLNQAISEASSVKIIAGTLVGILLLHIARVGGPIDAITLCILEVAIPVLALRWAIRFRALPSLDPEYIAARRTVFLIGLGTPVALPPVWLLLRTLHQH